jgi:hypothetical protein
MKQKIEARQPSVFDKPLLYALGDDEVGQRNMSLAPPIGRPNSTATAGRFA